MSFEFTQKYRLILIAVILRQYFIWKSNSVFSSFLVPHGDNLEIICFVLEGKEEQCTNFCWKFEDNNKVHIYMKPMHKECENNQIISLHPITTLEVENLSNNDTCWQFQFKVCVTYEENMEEMCSALTF